MEINKNSWYSFEIPKESTTSTAIDVSFLLDRPAGKHGVLKIRDGHFHFEDGTRARFWGANVVGANCFPEHERGERLSARLAKYGCNMLRFHHMDAPWATPHIFDQRYEEDTQHFSAESLDRLDYFIYQLKERGIYVYFDLLVHRKFKSGDGVRGFDLVKHGAKIVAHYDQRIIELQKKYAHDLLTHYNPYTKLRYIEEPAIALIGLINESSVFSSEEYRDVPCSYIQELNRRFEVWLAKRDLPPKAIGVPELLAKRNK